MNTKNFKIDPDMRFTGKLTDAGIKEKGNAIQEELYKIWPDVHNGGEVVMLPKDDFVCIVEMLKGQPAMAFNPLIIMTVKKQRKSITLKDAMQKDWEQLCKFSKLTVKEFRATLAHIWKRKHGG